MSTPPVLTLADVPRLRALRESGISVREIARTMQVSEGSIQRAVKRYGLTQRAEPQAIKPGVRSHQAPAARPCPAAIAPERWAAGILPLPAGHPLAWDVITRTAWPA